MKKIKVAIAIMAMLWATGAMAQVTLTGTMAYPLNYGIGSPQVTTIDANSFATAISGVVTSNPTLQTQLRGNQGSTGATGIGYYGLTSSTSIAITTGNKTFITNITQSGTAFAVGNRVRIWYATAPNNYMEGIVTAFNSNTMTVVIDYVGGSGTYSNWGIGLTGAVGSQGTQGIQGAQGVQGIQGIAGNNGASANISPARFVFMMDSIFASGHHIPALNVSNLETVGTIRIMGTTY